MPNNFFRFKQFTVNQDRCAMKVCTDACLFGAWTAAKAGDSKRILDMGAGTGLLSLMLAQKCDATIDAVEIDEGAYIQAGENFADSPWAGRLKAFHSRVQDFTNDKYDLVISNPPFYDNDLKSSNTLRNLALHSAGLDLNELLISVKRLLDDDGKFAVLLPFHRAEYFEKLVSQHAFNIDRKILVKQTTAHTYFRAMYLLTPIAPYLPQAEAVSPEVDSIVIKEENQYTQAFTDLLKDYYL